jgi:hypothetical protein
MARVYAKDVELRLPGREEKRPIEYRIWKANGHDGVEPVTRVEFQCRGEFLDEVGLRNPRELETKLDAVFQLCVRWVRFIEPGTGSRRSRCQLDPRWRVVTETVFVHQASAIMRNREHRGGARPSHVAGAVRSVLAAAGRLIRPNMVTSLGEVFADEREFAESIGPESAEKWVRKTHDEMFLQAAALVTEDILSRRGPSSAALAVATRTNATRARFSSAEIRGQHDGVNEAPEHRKRNK